ncbi:hypothetical protein M5K25_027384 [Dendrobium thyrsiflorum]|uniref:Uncharacterized protein n=1 Tax=Dendrobium thyrsiflorum TaxID=117978 RepID=A0ABD0TZR3_DENTH
MAARRQYTYRRRVPQGERWLCELIFERTCFTIYLWQLNAIFQDRGGVAFAFSMRDYVPTSLCFTNILNRTEYSGNLTGVDMTEIRTEGKGFKGIESFRRPEERGGAEDEGKEWEDRLEIFSALHITAQVRAQEEEEGGTVTCGRWRFPRETGLVEKNIALEALLTTTPVEDSTSTVHSNHSPFTLDLPPIYKPCNSRKSINRAPISLKRGLKPSGIKREIGDRSCLLNPPRPPSDYFCRTTVGPPLDAGVLPDHHLRPDVLPDHHLRPDVLPDHHLRPDVLPDHHLRPDVLLDHHLRPDIMPDHHLKPDVLLNNHLRPDVLRDNHLRPDILSDHHMKPDVLPNNHLRPDVLRDNHLRPDVLPDHHLTPDVLLKARHSIRSPLDARLSAGPPPDARHSARPRPNIIPPPNHRLTPEFCRTTN